MEAFNLEEGYIEVVTCPEWPPRRHRIQFENPGSIEGLGVFQLVRVEAREAAGKLLGVSVTPESVQPLTDEADTDDSI